MEKVLGKKLPFRKEFPNTGEDFTGHRDAILFLGDLGYSFGSMQGDEPIGLLKMKSAVIAKWNNLSANDRKVLNGVLTFENGGPRNGTAVVLLDTVVEGSSNETNTEES